MAVPARRRSKAKKNKQRTHKKLQVPQLVKDPVTGTYRAAHHIAPDGTYNGRQVVQPPLEKNK